MDTLCKNLLWIALTLVIGHAVTAQEKVSKKIAKTYVLTDSGKVHLENKYGNIKLFGWEKDEISIAINIAVSHRKMENAEDLMQRILPVIKHSDNYIFISYDIAEKNSGFFGTLFEKANPFDFDRSNVQIDYNVYMPLKAELEIKNIFGDVIIEDWTGKLKADVAHGDLWINEDLAQVDINVKYGKLRAQSIDNGTIGLKNGGFDMKNAKNLKVTSSGTDIKIDKIGSLEFFSNKDEVTLDEVGTIYGTLKFTIIQLNRLAKDVDLTMKIADVRISKILDSEADIAIDQESSEISLNITDFPHRFDATLEEGLVRLPKTYENVDSKMIDEGKRLRKIKATYGKNPRGEISITGKKGTVLLKEQEVKTVAN